MDKTTWRIAIPFAGAAVGGSFLSGFEWLRFFAFFGLWGMIGILLTGLGLAWFGSLVLSFCYRSRIFSLLDLFRNWFSEAMAPGLSVLAHFLLIGYLGTMTGNLVMGLSGGAVGWVMLFCTILIAALFLLRGWRALLSALGCTLAAGFLLFSLLFLQQGHVPIPSLGYQIHGFWIVQSLAYLSLHFLLCLALTIPFASGASSEKGIRLGVILGSLCFLALALLGHAVLLANWHEVNASSEPVGVILSQLWPLGNWLHALLAAVSAAVVVAALVYALAQPVSLRHDLQFRPLALVMIALILLFAMLATVLPWSFTLFASAATYGGSLLLIRVLYLRFKAS